MIVSLRHLFGWVISACRSREDLILENLALHQQLLALHSQRPRRRLTALHKLFWVVLRTFWSGWRKPLVLVVVRQNFSRDPKRGDSWWSRQTVIGSIEQEDSGGSLEGANPHARGGHI
jgi:hypothetical protein